MSQSTDSTHTSVTLAGGDAFPTLGQGTWKIPDELLPGLIQDAVKIGYRHFDCACDYGNEPAVGEGLKQAIDVGLCSRDDLWITSKLDLSSPDAPLRRRALLGFLLGLIFLSRLDTAFIMMGLAIGTLTVYRIRPWKLDQVWMTIKSNLPVVAVFATRLNKMARNNPSPTEKTIESTLMAQKFPEQ